MLQFSRFCEKYSVFWFYPKEENFDYTKDKQQWILESEQEQIIIDLDTKIIFYFVIGLFQEGKTIISWDIKRFFSYFYHRLGYHCIIENNATIFDLKYAESFMGLEKEMPANFTEAHRRLQDTPDCYEAIRSRIHIPLATLVVPKMETYYLLDTLQERKVSSCYVLEGQVNGRMKTIKAFDHCYVPHTLSQSLREHLKPLSSESRHFIVFDYQAMEVHVLAWLSNDPCLAKMISSKWDIYKLIYSLLFGEKCDEENRNFIKKVFLPVVYGLQEEKLIEEYGEKGKTLLEGMRRYFSVALSWAEEQQQKALQQGKIVDCCGRTRYLQDKFHIARNATVQGPAAIFCQEKLVELYYACRDVAVLVANVHDAYYLETNRVKETINRACEILQSSSQLLPGLFLKIDIKFGKDLGEMKVYEF